MAPLGFADKVAFVWKVPDKLRGTFKQHEYGSVMLPLLVLRRMDAVLAPTKQAVLDAAAGMSDIGEGQDTTDRAAPAWSWEHEADPCPLGQRTGSRPCGPRLFRTCGGLSSRLGDARSRQRTLL